MLRPNLPLDQRRPDPTAHTPATKFVRNMDSGHIVIEQPVGTASRDSSSDVIDDSHQRAAEEEAAARKAEAVREACRWRDISKLRSLAESEGGFLNDDLRKLACMFYHQTTRPATVLNKVLT